jgi:ATP-dependent protease ClpP protease subunit
MNRLFRNPVEQRSFPSGAVHNFYIYGPVSDDINEYVDMITILDIAEEHDRVNIFLNTPGGALDTAISLIHAIMRSRAQVVTHADGMVASAGTLLFFAASTYVIYPYATFMFHDGAMGIQGKINESMKNIASTSQLIERLARDLYMPTFSEDEVIDILEGRDYYCDSDEMLERIQAAVVESDSEEELEPELELQTVQRDYSDVEFEVGDRVQVIDSKLKSYNSEGTVTFVHVGGMIEVKLDKGNSITIGDEKLRRLD